MGRSWKNFETDSFEAILRAGKKGGDDIKAIQREAAADDFLDRILAAV
jgi:hypothetical protein